MFRLTEILAEEIFAQQDNLMVDFHDFPYVFTVFLLTSAEIWNPVCSHFEFPNGLSITLPQSNFQKRSTAELYQ